VAQDDDAAANKALLEFDRKQAFERMIEQLKIIAAGDASIGKAYQEMHKALDAIVAEEEKINPVDRPKGPQAATALKDRVGKAANDVIDNSPDIPDERKATFKAVYPMMVKKLSDKSLYPNIDENNVIDFLAILKEGNRALATAAVDLTSDEDLKEALAELKIRQEIKDLLDDLKAQSPDKFRKVFEVVADELKKIAASNDPIETMRRRAKMAVLDTIDEVLGDDEKAKGDWTEKALALLAKLKEIHVAEDSKKDLVEFYEDTAEMLAAAVAPPDADSLASEQADLNVLAAVADDIKRKIIKYDTSDEKTFKSNVKKFITELKIITRTSYSSVSDIEAATDAAARKWTEKYVLGQLAREAWLEGYGAFKEWLKKTDTVDGNSVKGWKEGLAELGKALEKTIDSVTSWLTDRSNPGGSAGGPTTGSSGRSTTGGGASFAAVRHERIMSRIDGRQSRRSYRIERIQSRR
jgi:hypothetical protein